MGLRALWTLPCPCTAGPATTAWESTWACSFSSPGQARLLGCQPLSCRWPLTRAPQGCPWPAGSPATHCCGICLQAMRSVHVGHCRVAQSLIQRPDNSTSKAKGDHRGDTAMGLKAPVRAQSPGRPQSLFLVSEDVPLGFSHRVAPVQGTGAELRARPGALGPWGVGSPWCNVMRPVGPLLG